MIACKKFIRKFEILHASELRPMAVSHQRVLIRVLADISGHPNSAHPAQILAVVWLN
jgi:hypothetical protein